MNAAMAVVVAAEKVMSGMDSRPKEKTPRVVKTVKPATSAVSAPNSRRAIQYAASTTTSAANTEGTEAVHCVTAPIGQDASAMSQACRGGLFKWGMPSRRGSNQWPSARMSRASIGNLASSFVAKTRVPRLSIRRAAETARSPATPALDAPRRLSMAPAPAGDSIPVDLNLMRCRPFLPPTASAGWVARSGQTSAARQTSAPARVLIEYLALGTEVPASGCEARRTAMRDELLSRTGEVSGREGYESGGARSGERPSNSNGRAEERGRRTGALGDDRGIRGRISKVTTGICCVTSGRKSSSSSSK